MGSFNSACSLSDLQINYNDEIIAFHLQKRNHHREYGVYPWDNYSIASVGFSGKYADYGRIELDMNAYNNFGLDLLEVNYDGFEEFQDENAMMFIHRGIYEASLQMSSHLNQEVNFLINAFDEYRTLAIVKENPNQAMQQFWDFCMNLDDEKSLPNFFILSSSQSSVSLSMTREIVKHFNLIFDEAFFPSEKSVSQLENFDLYMKFIIETQALTRTFFTANKRILPQFTTSQDTKWIEEATWQQKVLEFSNSRVNSLGSYYQEEVGKFKEQQKAMLERQIMEFGLTESELNNKKKIKV